jgi:hypothetical protein
MTIDPKKIFERLSKPESERGQLSLYLDRALYKRFKDFCDDQRVSSTRALEEFMRATLDDSQAGADPSEVQVNIPSDLLPGLASATQAEWDSIRDILKSAKAAKSRQDGAVRKLRRKTG